VQVWPIPDQKELDRYYSNEYFTTRTERGYNNYYSNPVKKELRRVWELNLKDLSVYENLLNKRGRSLDIGCAAGFYVEYMKELGWEAYGIEIAEEPVFYGRSVLGLPLIKGDFLNWDLAGKEKFELVTLWAVLEHMRDPVSILRKIRLHLTTGGLLLLSTCRWGLQSRWKRESWRFLNVPEHLFYFGWKNLCELLENLGFQKIGGVSYGSGYTMPQNPRKGFVLKKRVFDFLAKCTNQGDMMALAFQRKD